MRIPWCVLIFAGASSSDSVTDDMLFTTFAVVCALGCANACAAPSARTVDAQADALFARWLDSFVNRQVSGCDDEALEGGVLCPACAAMHGRAVDAVWPLSWQYKRTGNQRYLEAARRLVTWTRRNLLRSDGSIINDPNMEWRGISVFSQTAIGKALYRCGDALPSDVKAEWMDFFRRQSDYVRGWMSDRNVVANPNYRCCTPLAMELAARLLGDSGYRKVAQLQLKCVMEKIGGDGILTGEARPFGERSPKGRLSADIGYNVEESIPALIEWAELVGDAKMLEKFLACAHAHLDFFLPDGGIDDSFGSRAAKWTYWGSRTSDGALPMLAALARRGDIEAARAAGAVLDIYERCTDPKRGLLAGGLHYVEADELPCLHHQFAKLKTFPDFLEAHVPTSDGKGLFAERDDELRSYAEIGVWVAREGDWRATFSDNDIRRDADRRESTGCGTLTLLHHRRLGPVFVASMSDWCVLERMNMQTQIRSDTCRALTPRIETVDGYSSVFDDRVSFAIDKKGRTVLAKTSGRLRTISMKEGPAFLFNWEVSPEGVSCIASCECSARLWIPVVAGYDARVALDGSSVSVIRKEGELRLSANAPIEMERTDRPQDRIFSSQSGFLFSALSLALENGKEVRVRVNSRD